MKKLIVLLILSTLAYAKQVRVYVDVVGDLFHAGHVQFFKQAREYGDYLIVGIHPDEEVVDYKRQPYLTMEERRISIEACRYVDEVIINAPIGITEEWIQRYEIDLVIHGDDISEKTMNEHYAVPIQLGIFKLIPYTPGISTTDIIRRVQSRCPHAK
ncbi:MAG: adenylyltransferase/cytidyltransferase family protein [Chlamydiia bacterium]|nr:adenylyltransferase/cytidyltransferase family protein [Chlamydiia bacterium]